VASERFWPVLDENVAVRADDLQRGLDLLVLVFLDVLGPELFDIPDFIFLGGGNRGLVPLGILGLGLEFHILLRGLGLGLRTGGWHPATLVSWLRPWMRSKKEPVLRVLRIPKPVSSYPNSFFFSLIFFWLQFYCHCFGSPKTRWKMISKLIIRIFAGYWARKRELLADHGRMCYKRDA